MCPQTDYFHLFLCVAIIFLYGEDVTEQQLATDQMLLHFSNLSMHMNGELVLRKVNAPPLRMSSASAGASEAAAERRRAPRTRREPLERQRSNRGALSSRRP